MMSWDDKIVERLKSIHEYFNGLPMGEFKRANVLEAIKAKASTTVNLDLSKEEIFYKVKPNERVWKSIKIRTFINLGI